MQIKKTYDKKEILNAMKIGFEFELYSNLSIVDSARSIAKLLDKRVVIPMKVDTLNQKVPLYHSPIKPTSDIFKLEPDYSGGKNMCELITGPMKYPEARNVFIKIFEWISNNGYTNERCSVHINVSIDNVLLPTKINIENVNVTKFILDFDESIIYDIFPERKESVYARSIKNINLNSILFYSKKLEDFSANTLTLPINEKYFGVNFTKKNKGYLEYRYIGGKDYHKKTRAILNIIDYICLHLHKTLNFNGVYSESDKYKLEKLTTNQENVYKSFMSYDAFRKNYPNLKVSVDLLTEEQILITYWNNIREKLFSIITTGGITKGNFNYDTEVGKFQLSDAVIKNCYLDNIEFLNCKIQGVIHNSWFYNCKISNSRVHSSNAITENVFDFCKIAETVLHISNVCNDCYIENKKTIINCEINKGVIKNGEIGKLAKISKETLKVEG